METVEKATDGISPTHEPAAREPGESSGDDDLATSAASTDDDGGQRDAARRSQERTRDQDSATSSDNPWAGLLSTGVALLQQLAAAQSSPDERRPRVDGSPTGLQIVRSPEEGAYLKLPMPRPEAVQQVLVALQERLRGGSE